MKRHLEIPHWGVQRCQSEDLLMLLTTISSLQSDLDVKRELDIEDHMNQLMMII